MTAPIEDSEFVTVRDVRTRYRTLGDGEETILLVHGVGGYVESWEDIIPELADQYSVYALDLPGHGHTESGIKDFRVDTLSDFLAAFMDVIGIDRTHLAGLSFGTCIAVAVPHVTPNESAA